MSQILARSTAHTVTTPGSMINSGSVNHQEPSGTVTAQLAFMLRGIIDQFPASVPDPHSDAQRPDPRVDEMIQEKLRKWDLGMDSSVYNKPFIVGRSIAVTAYRHTPPELQVEIALYTGLTVVIDDGLVDAAALQEFVPRFCSGSRQLHPALDRFVESCHTLEKYHAAYGANVIFTCTMDFVNCELFLSTGKESMVFHRNSVPFIRYFREKDGIIGAFAAFIWPKETFPDANEYIQAFPDIGEAMNALNDIFSYYKEMKEGDQRTFLVRLATAEQKTELEELQDLINRFTFLTHRLSGTLGQGKAKDALESFVSGFIRFHLQEVRYRLVEVFPELKS